MLEVRRPPAYPMKTFLLALALALAIPACASCPPGIPKIVGLDYHTARAKLIKAGFLPMIDKEAGMPVGYKTDPSLGAKYEDLSPSMRPYGYIEGDGCATGVAASSFKWHGFTIHAVRCWHITSITCP
jgi:hypothetical protein